MRADVGRRSESYMGLKHQITVRLANRARVAALGALLISTYLGQSMA